MTRAIQAQAGESGPYNGEMPTACDGTPVSFRREDEDPNDYLYAIRAILFGAHRDYFDLLSQCAVEWASPVELAKSVSMDWLGEAPGRLSPQDATMLHVCGQIGHKQFGLSDDMAMALREVFPDNSTLSGGEVLFSEEAYDLMCRAAGMGEELSFDPGRWPNYDREVSPRYEEPSP